MRRLLVATISIVLLAAVTAHAQLPAEPRSILSAPLIVNLPPAPLSQRPAPPLTPEHAERLRKAAQLRDAGLLDQAREALNALQADLPHHPAVLSEMARVGLAKQDYAGVERLARAERTSQKDSLLLGRELAIALERLARPREAAQTAIEVWAVAPSQGEWAGSTMSRLAATEPRGTLEVMRRAVERLPARADVARGLARLEVQTGDVSAAVQTLGAAERRGLGTIRWSFAEEMLRRGNGRDSTAAFEVLLDAAGDASRDIDLRLRSARRAWDVARTRDSDAQRLARAIADIPSNRWPPELVADLARTLRRAGLTEESRALLRARGDQGGLSTELALEQALADLRDGPPSRALPALGTHAERDPEAAFRLAEALFFDGQADSAMIWYQRISRRPDDPFAGAALERIYLIEETGAGDRASFGRLAYEEWRGDTKRATALADSLYRRLPQGPSWAHAALILSQRLDAAGDPRAALAPLLAVADSLPQDRLAPLARQRAGDIYLQKLNEDRKALEQYEECLARYPRAWNAPEVRRRAEMLRKERRF